MGKRAKQRNPRQRNPRQRHPKQRNPKQSNPLRPRASRVKKARAPRSGLPDWYYRVWRIRWDREPFTPTNPYDFDEDLSELEEKSAKEECEDSECECQFRDVHSEDEESERSYDGSNAEDYYDLKREREERKREVLKERLDKVREKERGFEFERSKEEEVRAAERSLRKVQKEGRTFHANPRSLAGEEFQLFCSDHIDHFYHSGFYDVKRVNFYHPDDKPVDDDSDGPDVKSGDDAGLMYGWLFLDLNAGCKFGPFFPPDSATFRPVKVESCDGKYKLSLDFLGNGYLKLRVSRNMVFMGWNGKSPAEFPPDGPAPEVFEFVGIWRDPEKEKAEREKMEMEMKKLREQRRPPSPKESWFELNHPMGAYYDRRYAVDW